MPNGSGFSDVSNGFRGDGSGWASQLYPDIKSTGVFHCPDDGTFALSTQMPVSYGYNLNAAGATGSQFQAPANTVLLFEVAGDTSDITKLGNGAGSGDSTGDNESCAGNGNDLTRGGYYTSANGLHAGSSDFLLSDGHAKWLRGSSVSAGATNHSSGCPQDTSGTPCTADPSRPAASTDDPGSPATFNLN